MNKASAIPSFEGTQPYRVTAGDYLRMIAAGGFGDAHVELVAGELIEMAPRGLDHGGWNADIAFDLGLLYRPLGFRFFIATIVELAKDTVRAPDIAVVDCNTGGRKHLLPADIFLAVEIADSTLAEDLGRKRRDYAAAGIRHYWVVDVAGQRVHCHAGPQDGHYAVVEVIAFGDPISVPGTKATIVVS